MTSEQTIRDVITYFKGFTGFIASVTDSETGRKITNLTVRKATFYRGNSVLVFEFDFYSLIIKDALNCSYSNPNPTTLKILKSSGYISEIKINGLATSIDKFLKAFIPKPRINSAFVASS